MAKEKKKSKVYELKEEQLPLFAELKKLGLKNRAEFIRQIVEFIREEHGYDKKTRKCKWKAVVAVSGGIDSAVVAALAVRALGKKNVDLVKMPYEGVSSEVSGKYADLLAEALKVKIIFEMPIKGPVDSVVEVLREGGFDPTSCVIGNVMARNRMVIVYAIANIVRGKVLDTCNLIEILLGYFTKFGDGASDLNPVGGLLKTWIWDIARALKKVPEEIIDRIPSADLMEGQTDEGDMGISYKAADLFVFAKYFKGKSNEQLVCECLFPRKIVKMMNKKIADSEHKRELAPICRIVI